MVNRPVGKSTANFERNLEEIERFLIEAEEPQAFDGLLDELLDTVIPNLERFPEIGGPFLRQRIRSVEVTNAVAVLKTKLAALTPAANAIREYLLKHHVMLYAVIGLTILLLPGAAAAKAQTENVAQTSPVGNGCTPVAKLTANCNRSRQGGRKRRRRQKASRAQAYPAKNQAGIYVLG